MKHANPRRLLFAAPASGSGKTTVVCAVMRALKKRRLAVQSFKSGPDYIDPMFHAAVTGVEAHNLDVFLFGGHGVGEQMCRRILAGAGERADISVLEGAMGYYDGLGLSEEYSAYELARFTGTPVVLIVDGKGTALSLAAVLKGMAGFRTDSRIQGFIINNIHPVVYAYYKALWEHESGLKGYGCLPYIGDASVESRHLGLVTAEEVENLRYKTELLAAAAERHIDLDGLLVLAATAEPFSYGEAQPAKPVKARIAVAKDKAFCFYYDESLHSLAAAGAELIPFSPLEDGELPACDGIYIGGGYPELYAADLSANVSLRQRLRRAVRAGMPCFAECGGYMYLSEAFYDKTVCLPMVGVVPGKVRMTDRLTRFGYITLTAEKDTFLCKKGDTVRAHEFHYSDSTENGSAFTARKAGGKRFWPAVYAEGNILAGYPHIHFCGTPGWAENFVNACARWRSGGK